MVSFARNSHHETISSLIFYVVASDATFYELGTH